MNEFDSAYLIEILKSGVCTVTFKKVDGSTRIMKCTLNSDMLPQKEESKRTKTKPENVISVWDVESEGWRSFRFENVISLDFSVA